MSNYILLNIPVCLQSVIKAIEKLSCDIDINRFSDIRTESKIKLCYEIEYIFYEILKGQFNDVTYNFFSYSKLLETFIGTFVRE